MQEFTTWGPLVDGRPDPRRYGQYFRRWVRDLEREGYSVDWRILNAADFGAPTSRKRLFLVARADGQVPTWPEPTHGPGRPRHWRAAAECIDWTIPVPSIFDRAKPLAEMTQRRIAAGLVRFVLEGKPFLISIDNRSSGTSPVWGLDRPLTTVMTENRHALVAPFVSKFFGTSIAGQSIDEPLSTVTGQGGHHALCMAWIAKHYSGVVGQQMEIPLGTVTAVDHHSLCVADSGDETPDRLVAWITKYYGTDGDPAITEPLHTVTTKDRFGLVTIRGTEYAIVDIGLRMLTPRELYRAQGFPETYRIETGADGRHTTKTAQVRMCGNSVCPPLARALVAANYTERQAQEIAA